VTSLWDKVHGLVYHQEFMIQLFFLKYYELLVSYIICLYLCRVNGLRRLWITSSRQEVIVQVIAQCMMGALSGGHDNCYCIV